jgi:hypothetical protein
MNAYNIANCGNHPVSYDCDKTDADPCSPKRGTGGNYATLAQCRADCYISYNCENRGHGDQCIAAAQGTTGIFVNKAACESICKSAPIGKNQCNPSSAQGCNTCSDCCKDFIADGVDCDSCVINICKHSRRIFWQWDTASSVTADTADDDQYNDDDFAPERGQDQCGIPNGTALAFFGTPTEVAARA